MDPTLDFINPLFTMGQAAGRSSLVKEATVLNKKQREIMNDFRSGICNLVVATSVLEEGIDIPACNLIVRFDLAKTYCDYVQAKGKFSHFSFSSDLSFQQKLYRESKSEKSLLRIDGIARGQ